MSAFRLLNRLSQHADLDLDSIDRVRTGTAIWQMNPEEYQSASVEKAASAQLAQSTVAMEYYEMRRIEGTPTFDIVHALSAAGITEMRTTVDAQVGIIDGAALLRARNEELKEAHGARIGSLSGGSRFVNSPDLGEFEQAVQHQRVSRSSMYGLF